MSVHALTQSSVHVVSMYVLTRSFVHVLLQASLLVLLRVCVSIHGLPQASVDVIPRESVLTVVVTHLCLSFYPIHSFEVILTMALGQLMSTSGVISNFYCIIACNRQNIAPCSGLVNKSAYISPVRHYFRDKSPFSIR